MSTPDDDNDKPPRLHLGDLGTIFLAGVFLVAMLFMMFGPSPFEGVFKPKPEQKPDNEVTINLQNK